MCISTFQKKQGQQLVLIPKKVYSNIETYCAFAHELGRLGYSVSVFCITKDHRDLLTSDELMRALVSANGKVIGGFWSSNLLNRISQFMFLVSLLIQKKNVAFAEPTLKRATFSYLVTKAMKLRKNNYFVLSSNPGVRDEFLAAIREKAFSNRKLRQVNSRQVIQPTALILFSQNRSQSLERFRRKGVSPKVPVIEAESPVNALGFLQECDRLCDKMVKWRDYYLIFVGKLGLQDTSGGQDWIDECFALIDYISAKIPSCKILVKFHPANWSREDVKIVDGYKNASLTTLSGHILVCRSKRVLFIGETTLKNTLRPTRNLSLKSCSSDRLHNGYDPYFRGGVRRVSFQDILVDDKIYDRTFPASPAQGG